MKSSSTLTAAKTVVRWLRWAAILALVYFEWGGLVYSASGGSARPDVVQKLVGMFLFALGLFLFALKETAFVVTGAMIAPRARLTTAIVLAAGWVLLALRNHVLSQPNPGSTNYTHFTLETFGSVLGVVYIFWSEKAKGSVARVPPSQLSFLELPPGQAGKP
jgi:hypothetical protein